MKHEFIPLPQDNTYCAYFGCSLGAAADVHDVDGLNLIRKVGNEEKDTSLSTSRISKDNPSDAALYQPFSPAEAIARLQQVLGMLESLTDDNGNLLSIHVLPKARVFIRGIIGHGISDAPKIRAKIVELHDRREKGEKELEKAIITLHSLANEIESDQ
jgi:hypothetical protein